MKDLEKADLTQGNVIYEVGVHAFVVYSTTGTKLTLIKELGDYLTYIPDNKITTNPLEVEEPTNPSVRGKQMWLVEEDGVKKRKEIHVKMRRWSTEYGKIDDDGELQKGRSTETISYSSITTNVLRTDFYTDKFLKVNGQEIFFKQTVLAHKRVRALYNNKGLYILKYIEDNPNYTKQQIANYFKISQPAVNLSMSSLKEADFLVEQSDTLGNTTLDINYDLLTKVAEVGYDGIADAVRK